MSHIIDFLSINISVPYTRLRHTRWNPRTYSRLIHKWIEPNYSVGRDETVQKTQRRNALMLFSQSIENSHRRRIIRRFESLVTGIVPGIFIREAPQGIKWLSVSRWTAIFTFLSSPWHEMSSGFTAYFTYFYAIRPTKCLSSFSFFLRFFYVFNVIQQNFIIIQIIFSMHVLSKRCMINISVE